MLGGMRVLLALVAGCSFDPSTGAVVADASSTSDGSNVPIDARNPIDALADASPDAAPTVCTVATASTTGTDRGRVGGNGGSSQRPPIACDSPQQLVGLGLRMSNQTTTNGGRSAHALNAGCALVTVDSNGVGTTGSITTKTLTANGGSDWTPSTATPMTTCQPGWIIAGLSAHTGSSNNLFLDVSITCAKPGPGATSIVMTETLDVEGSLTEPDGLDTGACNPNELVVRMPNRIGAGVDSVNLSCSTLICN